MTEQITHTPPVITALLPDLARDISGWSTGRLRDALANAIIDTAQSLRRMAVIWRELEERGEDLSRYKAGLMVFMPLIAADRLDADVVVRCAGQYTVLRAISALPLTRQQQLLRSGAPVLRNSDPGSQIRMQLAPLEKLTVEDVRLAFGSQDVRTADEQRAILQKRKAATRGRRNRQVAVNLTNEEFAAIEDAARRQGVQIPVFLRQTALALLHGGVKPAAGIDDEIIAMYRNNMPVSRIAREVGRDAATVRNLLTRYGVALRGRPPKNP